MKRVILTCILLAAFLCAGAQTYISHIERSGSWYYLYDQNGKRYKSIGASMGELKGYSASMFILRSGSWYYIHDASGKRLRSMSVSTVGEIVAVTGDTFTSRSGSWFYTWDMNGKKISTRSAR